MKPLVYARISFPSSTMLLLLCFFVVPHFAVGQLIKKEEILINNGSNYANSYKAELLFKIKDDSIKSMLVSNRADFHGAHWVDYRRQILDWTLELHDGTQEVFAKFRYRNGKESELFSDEIIVDTTPPENPYIKIDISQKHSNDKSLDVALSLSAVDAQYVMISNSPSFYGQKWRIFKDDQIPQWALEAGGDGPRIVYAKFRDKAGNESVVVSDQIIIDTKSPFDVHVQVNEGQKYYTEQARTVPVSLFARGADSVMITLNDPTFEQGVWKPYSTSARVAIGEEDGEKIIAVRFKDLAGNISNVHQSVVILDTTPPRDCEVLINNGAESTNNIDKRVAIQLKSSDAVFYKLSNDPLQLEKTRWLPFAGLVENWQLSGEGDGVRTVYVKFKDEAGNVSKTYRATIMLERGF